MRSSSLLVVASTIVWCALAHKCHHHHHKRPVTIETNNGLLEGYEEHFLGCRVRSFLGVPYGESTGENARFKPPTEKKGWRGVRDATVLAEACYQGRDNFNTSFWGSEMWNANTPLTEDCLNLNIWTPAHAHDLPVMVWFNGGGFWYGSPSLLVFNGRALALEGNVIVVNVNFRYGPLGFLYLDHPNAPGNMGLLDQQLALQWIYENIEAFGGDPQKITLFGESSGGPSVVAHMIAPDSKELFDKVIIQSASLDNSWAMDSPARALNKSLQFVEAIGCNRDDIEDTIACLVDKPASDLIEYMWNVSLGFIEYPFVIVSKDKNFFREKDALVALRNGDYRHDLDAILGMVKDEGNFWLPYTIPELFDVPEQPVLSKTNYTDSVQLAFAAMPSWLQGAAGRLYAPKSITSGLSAEERGVYYADQVNYMVGDYYYTCDLLWLADQMTARNNGGSVRVYFFDQISSANPWPKWMGIPQGYEIEFVFGVPLFNKTAGYTQDEKFFSKKVVEYWSSFAHTGVPHLHHSIQSEEWPEYSSTGEWLKLKANDITVMSPTKDEVCGFWRYQKDHEYVQHLDSIHNCPEPKYNILDS